jgi:hypothetical protein
MVCKAVIHNIVTKLCSVESVLDKKKSQKIIELTEEKLRIGTQLKASIILYFIFYLTNDV